MTRIRKLGSLEAGKLGGKAPLAADEYKKGGKALIVDKNYFHGQLPIVGLNQGLVLYDGVLYLSGV